MYIYGSLQDELHSRDHGHEYALDSWTTEMTLEIVFEIEREFFALYIYFDSGVPMIKSNS